MEHGRKTLKSFFLVIGLVVLFYLVRSLYVRWHELSAITFEINCVLATLSVLVLIPAHLLPGIAWGKIIKSFDVTLPYSKLIRIHFLALLARYLPGGVLHFAGKVYLCKENKVSVTASISSQVLENVMLVFSCILVSSITLNSFGEYDISWLLGFSVLFLLIFIHPSFLLRTINPLLKKFNRKPITWQGTYRDLLIIFAYYILMWSFFILAFILLVRSVTVLETNKLIPVGGTFPASWIVGFFSPSPMGLGVREGVLTLLLNDYLQNTVALLIALISRIWLSVGELISLVIALILDRYLGKEKEPNYIEKE